MDLVNECFHSWKGMYSFSSDQGSTSICLNFWNIILHQDYLFLLSSHFKNLFQSFQNLIENCENYENYIHILKLLWGIEPKLKTAQSLKLSPFICTAHMCTTHIRAKASSKRWVVANICGHRQIEVPTLSMM